jgi:hypothetical protein
MPPGVVTVTSLAVSVALVVITQFAVTLSVVGVPVMVQVTPLPDMVTAVAPLRLSPVRSTATLVPRTPDTGEIEASDGAVKVRDSTAPTSTQACPLVFGLQFRPVVVPTASGLGLPKKSVVGRVIDGTIGVPVAGVVHWLAPVLEHGM